jgi:quinoprotein glucose dehydrogenase
MRWSATRGGPLRSAVIGAIGTIAGAIAILVGASSMLVGAPAVQEGAPLPDWEWRTYGADLANTRYAPLDQIDKSNFNSLQIAWRFKTDNLGPRPETNFQATPLMVGGVLYTTAGSRRAVVAIDAATGEMLWMHAENEGKRADAAARVLSGRGVAYWSDGRESRILYVTQGYRLVALNAKTGTRVPSFGRDGIVDLKLDDDQQMDLEAGEIGLQAAPVVAGDTVIIGAAHKEGSVPKSRRNEKGYVRGFDVRTGKRLWIFHTIPQPGEFGSDTWENGSAEYTGNTGVWTQISVDDQLGLAYLPVEAPTGDYYGGHRPGNNLFGESLVAVDLKTGKRKWHYQFIHHGLWDWDLPSAPVLADVVIDGRLRKIAAQPSKQAWLYVLDRETGEPIWPIVERPVPQSSVPGEKTSPTQPFPTKPPAFDRQGMTVDDLIDFTPALRAEAIQIASRYNLAPMFTPPIVSRIEGGPLANLTFPQPTGGANWPGASYDPESKFIYIYSKTDLLPVGLVPGEPGTSDMSYVRGIARNSNPGTPAGRGVGTTVQGLPLNKPPYGRITAIDLARGEIAWQIAHGETPDEIRNHPALQGLTIARTGRVGRIGTLTTKSLVIAGEGGTFTLPDGRRGAMLRAYDKHTGTDAGAVYMPAPQSGSPMTYRLSGEQYIVLAISAPSFPGELIAFKLPRPQRSAN